jgi:hypothetical protein
MTTFTTPGDRFVLPSGRAVQITASTKNGSMICGRYLHLGEPSAKAVDEVSVTREFLARFGTRLPPQQVKGAAA